MVGYEEERQVSTDRGIWPRVFGVALLLSVLGTLLLPSFRDEYWKGPNLYALQARAFLQGHLGLSVQHYDTAFSQGFYNVVNPPFPSFVLLPFVSLVPQSGDRVLSTVVALFLTAVAVFALNGILRKLEVSETIRFWSILGLFGGTGYWFCLRVCHGMWFFAHIVAITCLLLAIYEAIHEGRGWVVGLLLGAAFLSRQMMIYSSIFALALLWQQEGRRKWISLILCAGSLTMAVGFYLWFNWARFGNPFETGYGLLPQTDFLGWRQKHLGMFNPLYIPVNLINLFFQGPHVEFDRPSMLTHWHMNPFGISLTFGSPFLFLAFWGRWPQSFVHRTLWITILLTLIHALMYHTNGWVQVNTYRYALDFASLLLLLAALGAGKFPPNYFKALVMYSVVLNALALFWIPFIGQGYEQYLPSP